MTTPAPSPSRPKVVYAIIDRPPRKHWLRIGLAFVNRDGSLNVRIDAVPLTGSLHIRDDIQRVPDHEPFATRGPDDAPELPAPAPRQRRTSARTP